ncbi:two-component system sensor histidine kinase EnvZ [Aliidiomarina haloalkalitolerans]|uniref:histidine kinase n=1 Tax=Aliidiomarina haloalkalitolerans TaxID=859059 RepID=A0A432VVE9_9GAMM|nr:two-component system sensor histidine kinase EnvZ [Aliidiomarina haloalkalitolerans]RUO20567.1 two-component system sensor histidine kinase EnvZ [Aliidiomarina haloalkalitolerans]
MRTLLPKSAFARTVSLIALVLALNLALTYGLVAQYVVKPGINQLTHVITNHILIAEWVDTQPDPLVRMHIEDLSEVRTLNGLAAQDAGLSRSAGAPWISRLVSERLDRPAEVRFTTAERMFVWVNLDDADHWYQIPVEDMRGLRLWPSFLLLGIIGLVSVLGAAWFARSLNRPLRRLQLAAEEVVLGNDPAPIPEKGTEELMKVTRAFNRMILNLSKVDEDRALLLAGISHDLRTPLTRIRLAAEMMNPDDLLVDGIIQDVDDLNSILSQFSDFARASERVGFTFANINTLIEEVVAAAQYLEAEQIDLQLQRVPDMELQPVAVKRILTNLIVNAKRYGQPPIEIASGLSRDEEHVWFSVRDAGAGIPDEQVDAMFNPFTRGNAARSDEGTGLGLAIVKRFAQMHRGHVEARNDPRGGLRIRVTLPRYPNAEVID